MHDHDDAAFEAWAGARLAALLRFGFALTHDEGVAEDLVESALVRTALARRDLAGGDAERYARRVMVAEQQRAWRRPRRRAGVTAECIDPPAAAPAPDVVDVVAAEAEEGADAELAARDRVWRELVALPPRQRAVLVLRCYERRSAPEVAAVLACSVDRVERDTHGARVRLAPLR
jgi:RNA polymerase sigma factor (sigma-70 family)